MGVNRRTLLGSIGVATVGGLGIASFSRESAAVQADASFRVPDQAHETHNPVSGVTLAVDVALSVTGDYQPDRAVLRLEAARSGDYRQLDALEVTDTTTDVTLSGNLLDLSGVTASDLSPANTGDTESVEIDARLKVEVYHEGSLVDDLAKTQTFTLSVTKTRGEIVTTVDAIGETTIQTADA